ncbi:NUDIX hydrolase [Streptomyces sp. NBC_01760]|uniref:NUDIX hydrolase n=1 Tax=Streptomyces sp. NBC_01760 TaxID=2975931 RepID=UPI002DD9C489|nr:NUDIX hydrolase [Streptomyces sp. NBC_01760]WSC72192.1 NUDIX hydrolase [Streptomyces sp. NBC_01760]
MIGALAVQETLTAYLDAHPEEKGTLAPFSELLGLGVRVTSRMDFRGHVTAGAVVFNDLNQVLHIHHRGLNRWLRPGGHLETQDSTLLDAALRELAEETGIRPTAVDTVCAGPIHIDVHPIPANEAKGEPAHQHFDCRYLFRTSSAGVLALQAEEVTDYAWRDVDEIEDETLRQRVAAALATSTARA